MKTLFTFLAMLLTISVLAEVDTLYPVSKITNVTVFFEGAQVERQAKMNLEKGKHLLIFENLPPQLDESSIQVMEVPDGRILSVKHEITDNWRKQDIGRITDLKKQVHEKRYELRAIKDELEVLDLERKLLLDNSDFSSVDMGKSIETIKVAAEYYRKRLLEIKKMELDLNRRYRQKEDDIKNLNTTIGALTYAEVEQYARVLIALEVNKTDEYKVLFNYFILDAGWDPVYDFRVSDLSEPLTIVYNANVHQSTGELWKNVNLKLSSGHPSLSGHTPVLYPWTLGRKPPQVRTYASKGSNGTLKGQIIDYESGEPIPFANVILERNGRQLGGAASDFDGYYTIKPIDPGTYDLKVSTVGYKPMSVRNLIISPDKILFYNAELESQISALAAVEIVDYKVPLISADRTSSGGTFSSEELRTMPGRSASGAACRVAGVFSVDGESGSVRGARKEGTTRYIDGIKVKKTPMVVTRNYMAGDMSHGVSTIEYEIEIPYTITSDGEEHNIKIKESKVDVDYEYRSVPKLEKVAYLNAMVRDWQKLGLLSGNSSIYFEGKYVGDAFLDAGQSADTLELSLGRDEGILVERKRVEEMEKRSFTSNNVRETVSWEIILRNNKADSVRVEISDQVPLSAWKWVDVEVLDKGDAKYNEKTGILDWTISLSAGERKAIRFTYEVKYPRTMHLNIE